MIRLESNPRPVGGRSVTRPRRPEHPLLNNRGLDRAACLILLACTFAIFLFMWFPSTRAVIQQWDDAIQRQMVEARDYPAFTPIAKFFNVLGSFWVTFPLRVAVLLFLGIRRRWWHFTAFLSAVVLSEISIGTLKNLYDRPRPPNPYVTTSGASFPSGHAIAASVTAVALVIAMFPPGGRHRAIWGAVAALFSFVMAFSRVYLSAHWTSDVVAGTLLGVTIAVCTAYVVQAIRGYRTREPAPERGARAAPSAA
jgi:membrane-associated phospholipid phosphatase